MTHDDEAKNLAVIAVTARATSELSELFGFTTPDYGGDEMLALQSAIYDIFGTKIAAGTLNATVAGRFSN